MFYIPFSFQFPVFLYIFHDSLCSAFFFLFFSSSPPSALFGLYLFSYSPHSVLSISVYIYIYIALLEFQCYFFYFYFFSATFSCRSLCLVFMFCTTNFMLARTTSWSELVPPNLTLECLGARYVCPRKMHRKFFICERVPIEFRAALRESTCHTLKKII